MYKKPCYHKGRIASKKVSSYYFAKMRENLQNLAIQSTFIFPDKKPTKEQVYFDNQVFDR